MLDTPEGDSSDVGDGGLPEHEPGAVPLRPVAIVAAVLLVAAIGFIAYSCSRSTTAGNTFSDKISHYAPGSVTYLDSGRTYLVRKPDGSFIALSEVEASASDRIGGCIIRYRPDLTVAGQSGVFRDDCQGAIFNRDGVAIQGSAPPMEQHPVETSGDQVSVQLTTCLAGGGKDTPEPCRE